jgi:hypothetical protein
LKESLSWNLQNVEKRKPIKKEPQSKPKKTSLDSSKRSGSYNKSIDYDAETKSTNPNEDVAQSKISKNSHELNSENIANGNSKTSRNREESANLEGNDGKSFSGSSEEEEKYASNTLSSSSSSSQVYAISIKMIQSFLF